MLTLAKQISDIVANQKVKMTHRADNVEAAFKSILDAAPPQARVDISCEVLKYHNALLDEVKQQLIAHLTVAGE